MSKPIDSNYLIYYFLSGDGYSQMYKERAYTNLTKSAEDIISSMQLQSIVFKNSEGTTE